jgi:hypothetical protein
MIDEVDWWGVVTCESVQPLKRRRERLEDLRGSAIAAGLVLSAAEDAQARLESITLRWTACDELGAAVRRVVDRAGVHVGDFGHGRERVRGSAHRFPEDSLSGPFRLASSSCFYFDVALPDARSGQAVVAIGGATDPGYVVAELNRAVDAPAWNRSSSNAQAPRAWKSEARRRREHRPEPRPAPGRARARSTAVARRESWPMALNWERSSTPRESRPPRGRGVDVVGRFVPASSPSVPSPPNRPHRLR